MTQHALCFCALTRSSVTCEMNFNFSGVDYYIFCIGGYRTLYACNWIYKYYISEKVMIHSTIGGVIEIAFFGDFLMYAITGASFLRTAILGLDDKLNDVSDQIELKVFPNRADEVEQNRLRRRNMGDQEYRQVIFFK